MKLVVTEGTTLSRNNANGPDVTDPAFNLIKGEAMEVVQVNPGRNIEARVTHGVHHTLGIRIGIPEKYLTDEYFTVR